jgi:hypothetical protein
MTPLYEIVIEKEYHRSEEKDKHNDDSVDEGLWTCRSLPISRIDTDIILAVFAGVGELCCMNGQILNNM